MKKIYLRLGSTPVPHLNLAMNAHVFNTMINTSVLSLF